MRRFPIAHSAFGNSGGSVKDSIDEDSAELVDGGQSWESGLD